MLRVAMKLALCTMLVISAGQARGALITYIGSDEGANSTDPRPNSDAAAASFDAAAALLGTMNTITFESSPLGSFTNLSVAPGVSMNGIDVNNSPQTILNAPYGTPDRLFGYNTTSGGSQFASLFGGTLTFTFASPIQAFGAYLSGIQFAGETITFDDGSSQTIDIPTLSSGIAFVGFTDEGKNIVGVTIDVTGDIVGVDDVRYGPTGSPAVPEPSTMAIGLLGSLAFLAYARRSRGRSTR